MTHPLSNHWEQPNRNQIELTKDYAHMNLDTMNALAEYSTSIPSGVYGGKMWKRKINNIWHLCWYQRPYRGKCTISSIPISLK